MMLRRKMLVGAMSVVLVGMLLSTALFASYAARMSSMCEGFLSEYHRNSIDTLREEVWKSTFYDLDVFVENLTAILSLQFERISAKALSLAQDMPSNYMSTAINGTITGERRSLLNGTLNGTVDGDIRGYMSGWLDGSVRGEMWGDVRGTFRGRIIVPRGTNVTGTYNGNDIAWGNGTYEVDGTINLNALAAFVGEFAGTLSGRYCGRFTGALNGSVSVMTTIASFNAQFSGEENLLPLMAHDALRVLAETNLVYRAYYGTVDGAFITSDDNEFGLPFIGTIGYDHRIRDWYIGGLSGPHLTGVYVDAGGAGLMVTYSVPVVSGGETLGVIGVDITLGALINLTVRSRPWTCGYFMMVSPDGEVIAHPDIEAMQYNATLWRERVQTENIGMSSYPQVRNITAVKSGEVLHFYLNVTEPDGLNYSPASRAGEYFVSYSRTEVVEIVVIGVLPAEVAYAKLNVLKEEYEREYQNVKNMTRRVFYVYTTMYLLSTTATLVLMLIFVGLIVKSLISPLERLTSLMDRISRGDLDLQVPKALVERDDEIGKLAWSFRRMLNSIKVLLREMERR